MIIAISGKSGCGNTTVSGLVANRLGFALVNYTLRDLAAERGISFDSIREMVEQDAAIDRLLDRRQVEKAQAGDCVLASRLSIWLLLNADLRVFLTASVEVRARRIHQREQGKLEEVIQNTRERDRLDRQRFLQNYGIDNDQYEFADLIIDTEKYNAEECCEIIVARAKELEKFCMNNYSPSLKKTAAIFLATGFEEIEATTPIDLLRRANIQVSIIAVGERTVRGAHGIDIVAEIRLEDFFPTQQYDVYILPGGDQGASNLARSKRLLDLLQKHAEADRLIAAICAAPIVVLGAHSLLKGRSFTCYPGYERRQHDGTFLPERVVCEKGLITGQSAGSAAEFSISIIEALLGKDAALEIFNQIIQRGTL